MVLHLDVPGSGDGGRSGHQVEVEIVAQIRGVHVH